MKTCSKCRESKPLDAFHRDSTKRDGIYPSCRDCCAERVFRAYNLHPEKFKERSRRNGEILRAIPGWKRSRHLWEKYHMTLAEYDERLAAQGGKCLFCSKPPSGSYELSVDHDHASGRVRALLCVRHNTGLGSFGDDPAQLRAAAAYLESHV